MPKMMALLKAVHPYIEQGHFQTIRVSTRPDAIDEVRLRLIKNLGVSTIELGVQSLEDNVLKASKRGYTRADVTRSVQMLHKHAFRVGIQLMPGLPEDSYKRFMNTIQDVLRLKPHMVRLYPAIVIKGTELEQLYHAKKYQPLSLEEAVSICQDSCLRLEENGVPVIRMGLMASPSLIEEGQIVAGPWHEAFGFLVRSSIHQKSIEPLLPPYGTTQQFGLRVPDREIPLVRGYKNQGLDIIEKKTGAKVIYVKGDASVPSGQVQMEGIKRTT
jgi:histone acetyltransferase (RNA polymerase elongator complex component)